MVIRSLVVLFSAVLVGISPAWLNMIASLWGGSAGAHLLPFSPYWIAVPGAVAIGISWVFEMGYHPLPEAASKAPAGGFDWMKARVEYGDRRAPSAERAAPGAGSVWFRLETDFQELLQSGADLDATWERTSAYGEAAESWRVTGASEGVRVEEKFVELANTAGRMLLEGTGYKPPLSAPTARQSMPLDRWLCALRDREIKTETWAPGQVMNNGAVAGHLHGGAIRHVIAASVEMCVQLTLEESLGGQPDMAVSD